MKSHEVLKQAITKVGAKAVASEMSLSTSLIYKWCEPSEAEGAAGADNPLDRLKTVYQATDDTGPITWLCQQANGFFVANPTVDLHQADPVLPATRRVLKEFTELLDAVSDSVADDGRVDKNEADKIRAEWEDLKAIGEGFVVACEAGAYREGSEKQ